MKKEFFKLTRNSLVFIWIFMVIITLFVAFFYYNSKSVKERGPLFHVAPYSSHESLKKNLEVYQMNLTEARAKNMTNEVEYYQELIEYASFINDNYVAYDKLSDISDRRGTASMVAVYDMLTDISAIFSMFAMIALPLIIVNADYVDGTYKMQYIGCKKRRNILLKKYYVCIVSILVVFALTMLLPAIMSFSYHDKEIKIIYCIFGNITYFSEIQYILLSLMGTLELLLVTETLFFSISIFVRPIVWAGISSLIFQGLILLLTSEKIPELSFFVDVNAAPLSTRNVNSVGMYLLLFGIRFVVVVITFIASIITFEKRDL